MPCSGLPELCEMCQAVLAMSMDIPFYSCQMLYFQCLCKLYITGLLIFRRCINSLNGLQNLLVKVC